ncbi:ribosome maturation factor RimP [candidate division KSB1 bacterium]|nr:ribosome maturation factor RimP [candidate division KSB1 bacterium]
MNDIEKIKTIVLSVLDELGIELVDILLQGNNRKKVLRVYVHEEGGITLDRCVRVSRMISDLLDRDDIITGRYTLEVSSPGLDRPLKSARDFERNTGEKVKAIIKIEGQEKEITGRINEVKENNIYLLNEDEEIITFELVNLQSAKIFVEF